MCAINKCKLIALSDLLPGKRGDAVFAVKAWCHQYREVEKGTCTCFIAYRK